MAFSFDVLTLFPKMIVPYVSESILGKAQERGHIAINVSDIRDFAADRHRVTDDTPSGGGAGMIMKVDCLVSAIEAARTRHPNGRSILMSPRGGTFNQSHAKRLAAESSLILVCGRYEGGDERVMRYVDEEISVGDFVLTGGELAALCLIDAVSRLVPNVLGNANSIATESFEDGLLEHPQYTRPAEFRGDRIPAVLMSGDHLRVARWRRWKRLHLTAERRPDLFNRIDLGPADRQLFKLAEEDL